MVEIASLVQREQVQDLLQVLRRASPCLGGGAPCLDAAIDAQQLLGAGAITSVASSDGGLCVVIDRLQATHRAVRSAVVAHEVLRYRMDSSIRAVSSASGSLAPCGVPGISHILEVDVASDKGLRENYQQRKAKGGTTSCYFGQGLGETQNVVIIWEGWVTHKT